MSEFDNPWAKPLWQRNAEDNMSLRHEIEKNYDFSNSNDPNCYMEFDGKNVDLYKYGQHNGNRLQNGLLKNNLSGQSGDDYHQGSIYQNVANKGPIPEGTYYANQDQRQSLTLKNIALKTAEKLGVNTNQKSNI